MRLGIAPICLASAGVLLPWVLGDVTAPVEKQFGPSELHSKPEMAAGPLWGDGRSLVLGDVGTEVGEVAKIR